MDLRPGRGVGGSFCRNNRAHSELPASGPTSPFPRQSEVFFHCTHQEETTEDVMPITSDLFEAYLKCPTKCFLRSLGETGTNNSYANWVRTQYLSYSSEGINSTDQPVRLQSHIAVAHVELGRIVGYYASIAGQCGRVGRRSVHHIGRKVSGAAMLSSANRYPDISPRSVPRKGL